MSIRAESEYQVSNIQLLFRHSSWVRILSFKVLFWHSSWVMITLDDFSSILFISGCFDIRAKSKYLFFMPKCYFDIFWHSSWVIFRHYSTRGYLSFSAKKPIFDLVWDRDINHCLGTYMFCLDWIFMKLADNQDKDTVLDVFEFEPDKTFHYRVICPWVPKAYIRHCQFRFNQILWTWLAGNQGGHIYKISEEFESCPDQIIHFGVNCRRLKKIFPYVVLFSFDSAEQPLNLNNGEMLFTIHCWSCCCCIVFYGPSTHFRSFRARSFNLSTLFLAKPPRQFTST